MYPGNLKKVDVGHCNWVDINKQMCGCVGVVCFYHFTVDSGELSNGWIFLCTQGWRVKMYSRMCPHLLCCSSQPLFPVPYYMLGFPFQGHTKPETGSFGNQHYWFNLALSPQYNMTQAVEFFPGTWWLSVGLLPKHLPVQCSISELCITSFNLQCNPLWIKKQEFEEIRSFSWD